MKKNKLIAAMALSMSLTLVSCSDDEKSDAKTNTSTPAPVVAPVKKQATASIMDFIPADTPILVVFANDPKHPLPQNFINKINKLYDSMGDIIKASMDENLKKYSNMTEDGVKNKSYTDGMAFMDKWLSKEGFEKMGFKIGESEFAFYTVDLFPVLRMTLAQSHSMPELFDELVAKANESKPDTAVKRNVDGKTVYQFGDKEIQVMVSIDGNNLAASFAPPRQVDNLMPKLLGFDKPAKTLKQSAQYNNTLSKYNFLSNTLYWFNFRDLADYFVNPANHKTAMLDILKIQDNMLSPDCKTEILGLFDKMPRLVGGGSTLNEHKMDSRMIIEMTEGLGSKLSTISGRIPKANSDAALSYGFSFDIAAAKQLAQEFVTSIETAPYKCEYFAGMNAQASTFKAQLNQPLPPFVGNFKGFNLVVDDIDLDFTKTDPKEMIKNLQAKMLLAVDNPEAIQGMAAMALPQLQELGLKKGGDAINISSLIPVSGSMMPINLDHVFLAMGTETIGLSLGEVTATALKTVVAADSTNALFDFSIKAGMYKDLFAGISEMATGANDEMKKQLTMQQKFMNEMLWWNSESGTMDFTDNGLELNVDIDY